MLAFPVRTYVQYPGGVLHRKPHNGVRIDCRVRCRPLLAVDSSYSAECRLFQTLAVAAAATPAPSSNLCPSRASPTSSAPMVARTSPTLVAPM